MPTLMPTFVTMFFKDIWSPSFQNSQAEQTCNLYSGLLITQTGDVQIAMVTLIQRFNIDPLQHSVDTYDRGTADLTHLL